MDGPLGGASDPRSGKSERDLINRQIGPYQILDLLGSGGMGEVYRARDTKLQRDVAIKVLPAAFTSHPDRLARFEREARVLASVNHPNIGGIYGFEESDGLGALALELVGGATLAELVAVGPLPIRQALTAARDVASALEAAHEKGIVHRDLKPSNIKITESGTAKVLDFGIAKVFANDSAAGDSFAASVTTVEHTREGLILGTASYMSPEQARGKPLDKRTDIWAFGCVLYELLTGRKAFGARESVSEMIAAILEHEPDWRALPEATPQIVRRLLRRCLEKDPRQRLHDIGDARLDLEETLDTHGTASSRVDIVVAGHPRGRTTRLTQEVVVPLAALVMGAVITVAMLYFTGRLSESGEPVETRFQVLPPAGATFDGSHALSPDGRWLVFVASSQGQAQLWLRPRDSVVAQPLNGTNGARSPFWSPDSHAIAFFAAGKLRILTVPNGIPQTIADAANPNSGTWNRDDVIVFVPSDEGGLYRVAATGGEPARIPTVDRAGQPLVPHFPCFLPDDHRFVYYGASPHPDRSGIYVGSLDAGPSDLVLSTNLTKVVYAPPGYLLFARERALVAQAFDERDLKLVGRPFQPAGITYDEANGATFSTSGTGTLAVWAGQLRNGQIVVFDRSGSRLRQFGEAGDYAAPSLSPDQSQLAVERLGEARHSIWLINWERQIPSGFATYAWGVHHPVWSPDGHWIAYTDSQSLHRKTVAADAADELLTSSTGVLRPTDWRGNALLYEQAAPGTAWDIWYLPLAGPRKPLSFLQTAASEVQGHLSPNGQWLAYTSDESGTLEVYVRSFPSAGEKQRVSITGGAQPKWRSDGKEIFYLGADRRLMAVEVRSQSPLAFGDAKPLFSTGITGSIAISPSSNNNYAVTSDGQRFFVNTRVDQQNIAPITVVLNWTRSLRQ